MNCRYRRESVVNELADQGQDLELVKDVEVGGRLVEQQHLWLLRHRAERGRRADAHRLRVSPSFSTRTFS